MTGPPAEKQVDPVEVVAELLWRTDTIDGQNGKPWPPDTVAASRFRADARALRDAGLLASVPPAELGPPPYDPARLASGGSGEAPSGWVPRRSMCEPACGWRGRTGWGDG